MDISDRPPCLATAVVDPNPFFLDTPNGRLFAIHHRPITAQRGNVLCIPPFNEEMNRCRSMITLQAQELAAVGIGTLLVDLHGTGDSAGEYRDARWSIWLDDIRRAVAWLDAQPGGCAALWGIRLGAIMAAETLRAAGPSDKALILWQPVVDGKQYFTQFLRMRIAAQMDRPHLPKETTASMRGQLASGDCVEIGGYEIHPDLSAALDAASLAKLAPPARTPVLWVEQASAQAAEVSPASATTIETWTKADISVDIRLFDGPAFWQLHQRAEAPGALGQTTAWVNEQRGRQ
jgi:exosortase A-associated hydrolase 2